MAKASAEDVAAAFPDAVQFAKLMRDAFGDGVRITYARNGQGQEIGRRYVPKTLIPLPHTRK
jgi:hypothetical protein